LKNSRWKKRLAYALFEREHLHGARCLRALCAAEARAIRQLGLQNDIAIIPNGVDLPEMENAETLKSVPWENVVEADKKILLFLSRIHPKKGLANLLKAWAKNRKSEIGNQKSDEWILAIAGWDQGGHEAELKRLCAALEIPFADIREPVNGGRQAASVLFLGPQFNVAKAACYHHCDAFVLPSFSEGLPMVVLEAWANAKPVLMTPECNLPEGFQAGAAIQLEPTETGVAAGLQELRRMSDTERNAMGQRARALVAERFTWPHIARQMESVHAWMLGGGKPACFAGF
jgi:poly(glycerol-phosphate) alpha-glucosyltransferase